MVEMRETKTENPVWDLMRLGSGMAAGTTIACMSASIYSAARTSGFLYGAALAGPAGWMLGRTAIGELQMPWVRRAPSEQAPEATPATAVEEAVEAAAETAEEFVTKATAAETTETVVAKSQEAAAEMPNLFTTLSGSEAPKAAADEPVEADVAEAPEPETADVPKPSQAAGEVAEAAAPLEAAIEAVKPPTLAEPREGIADDLRRIKGIGPKLETLLFSLGIYHVDQIAAWTEAEVAWVDANLEGFLGRATRDDWVGQAKALLAGTEG